MANIIPSTGKPADMDLTLIVSVADADRALSWLSDVLADMDQQVRDRGAEDQEWLLKLRAAQRATKNLRHRVLEMRDDLVGQSSFHEAVAHMLTVVCGADQLERYDSELARLSPHLRGFGLSKIVS